MRTNLPPAGRPAERRLAGIALRLGAVAGFGLMAAAVKLGSERGVSIVEMIFARNLFALPLTALWITLGPGWHSARTRRPAAHAIRAALGIVSMMLTFGAVSLLPLADATTIGFSAPIFATILSAVVLNETIGRHRWGAVAAGLLGVAIVMRPGGSALAPLGLLVGVASAVGVAGVNITVRQIAATENVAAMVLWFTVACLIVSGLAMPFFVQSHDMATWGIMLLMGLGGGIGQICNTGSLRLAPVSVVAPFDYAQLLWTILLGWIIWSAFPSANMLAGASLIVASGLYTVFREHRLHRQRIPAVPPDS